MQQIPALGCKAFAAQLREARRAPHVGRHAPVGFEHLGKKDRRAVEVLSAFLRLAETLDRSRHGVIRGIEVRERLGELRINVQAVGDSELEVWAAHKQVIALEEALGRTVTIEKVPYRKASRASV
jgi:exopolyphosphatase/pppGpp-phosphohydrolase